MHEACVSMGSWCCGGLVPATEAMAQPAKKVEYRVIATSKTSTMEKELNEAAEAGRRS